MTDGKNCQLITIAQLSALTNLNNFHRCAPFRHYTLSAWVTNAERFFFSWDGRCIHQIPQLLLIHWCRNDHVWQTTEIGDVIGTMMGWPIRASKTCPVQTEIHR